MLRKVVLLAGGLITVACSSAVSASDIEGIWEVQSFRWAGSTQDVAPGVNVVHTPWVSIEDDTVEGEAGCNGLGGSFSVTDSGALLMEDVFMELAFCLPSDTTADEDAVMQADFAFQAVMWDGEVAVSVSGEEMVWTSGDDSITFKSVSAPPTTEPFVPPRFTEIGRLDCAPNYVEETRVPDTGQGPLEIAQGADPDVVTVEPGEPLWHSGLDAEGNVIVELALGDADGADYQVWTCEN